MDPDDVLDFGEDDDGLDVISLGASDHDGRPVSNRSGSSAVESTSRSIRQPRPSPPNRRRHSRSASHTQPNGADRRRHGSAYRTTNPPQAHSHERNHQPLSRSADRTAPHPERRSLFEGAARHGERSSVTAPVRRRPPSDRPRPGERASYMPPDRLQAISGSSRKSDPQNPKNASSRPTASLSTRITDRRDPDQKASNPLSSSKLAPQREKFEEAKDVKKPVEPPVDPDSPELPEGWISRISKGSKKTYYVNQHTRTSQWNKPTEPASDKPTKPTPKVAPKSAAKQPAQEIIKTLTHQDLRKSDVLASATDSPMVSRSQKEGPDLQACKPSQSCDGHSLDVRPSSKASLHDGHQLETAQEPIQHDDASKPPIDDDQRESDLMGSRTAHASDSDIDGQSIHQEKTQPDLSEPYLRDHRIHPDRRQEIASAHAHRGRASAPEPPKAISVGSIHCDPPLHPDIINRDRSRHGVPARYPHEFDSFRSPGNQRPRSISPGPRLVPSHRNARRGHREPVHLSGANGTPKAPGRSFPDAIMPSQPHELYTHPDVSRYSKPLSIPPKHIEPPDYRDIDWRRRSDRQFNHDMPSPDSRPSSWSRQEVGPISPIYSSHRHPLVLRPGSTSPPPGRMAPTMPSVLRAPLHTDLFPTERARPPPASSRVFLEDRPFGPPEPSDSMRRNTAPRYDAYRPSALFTPETNGHRPHDPRRSDPYYPRAQGPHHSELSHEDIRRSPVVQNLPFLSEPSKINKGMGQPDFYRPPAHAQRASPRRTEPPKYYPIIDLDEIPNKAQPPPGLTGINAHAPPAPAFAIGKASRPSLKEQAGRAQDYNPCQLALSNLRNLPANNTRAVLMDDARKISTDDAGNTADRMVMKSPPANASAPSIDGASQISIDDASRAVMNNPNEASSKATLGIPKRHDRNGNGRRGESIEPVDVSGKDANASSDIMEIPPPQPVQVDAEPPKQPVSLAKRLGPVADCSGESNKFSPPAKRSRPNPVDGIEVSDMSNDFTENPKVSPLPEEISPSKKNASSSPSDSSTKIQTQLSLPERPPKLEPNAQSYSSAQTHQEKVISLRGRARRKSAHTAVAEQQRSQVEEKGADRAIPTPPGNGSLRDRIQDLNFSPMPSVQLQPSSPQVSPIGIPHRPQQANHPHGFHYGRPSMIQGPPVGRHISERISGFRAPFGHSPSGNGNHRPHAPRQSDSGWNGRKAKYP